MIYTAATEKRFRPIRSRLNSLKLQAAYNLTVPRTQPTLSRYLARLTQSSE